MRPLLLLAALAAAAAELPHLEDSEGSGDDGDDEGELEGSGEFIEDLKEFGEHNKVLKVVPDSDQLGDFHFGKEEEYYEEEYYEEEYYKDMLEDYDYGDKLEDSVLKVTVDEENVQEPDIEIKAKPPTVEDELLLDTAQILIMVGSAFISFGVVMLAFFLCRQRLEAAKEKAMPYTIPASRPSPIVKDYQRVPTSTQQLLAAPRIEMYRGEKGAPLLP